MNYEVTSDRAAVAHVVAMHPLTAAVAHALNPDADLAELRAAGHLRESAIPREPRPSGHLPG